MPMSQGSAPGYPGAPGAGPGAGYGGYGPSGPGQQPWAAPPAQKPTDPFAVTSLVTGLVGLFPLGIGFGIAALRRIGRGERSGKGLAIAGLVLSGLSIIGWVALAGVLVFARSVATSLPSISVPSFSVTVPGKTPTASGPAGNMVAPGDLKVGDCLNVPESVSVVDQLEVLPCTQLHNGQVFVIAQAQEATYPGSSALKDSALSNCQDQVSAFLGSGGNSDLHIVAFIPTQAQFNGGDKSEQCVLVDRQKNITGDIRDDTT
jgi:hypothetical protein